MSVSYQDDSAVLEDLSFTQVDGLHRSVKVLSVANAVASVVAFTLAVVGVLFGTTTFFVWVGHLGTFYGPGWLGLAFLVGLPSSLAALAVVRAFSIKVRSFAWFVIVGFSVTGFGLSLVGAFNVLHAVLNLV